MLNTKHQEAKAIKKRSFKSIVNLLTCVSTLVLTSNTVMASIAGKTILTKGEVKATNNDTFDVRSLRRRANIFSVDSIVTGVDSKAQFSMSDGGVITLKANTELKISEYSFDKNTEEGSAALEIVSGGFRSVSGLIKKSGGDYQVKTPIGSIGIRGTHFAIEVSDDDVVFGVFSGNIDVLLHNQKMLSLGADEDFAFASVTPEGNVTLLTKAPPSIAAGLPKGSSSQQSNEDENEENTAQSQQTNSTNSHINGNGFDSSIYNESALLGINGASISELITQRTGTLTYNNFGDNNIVSSQGQVTDFSISMSIDFDNGTVPKGELSFTDPDGEWFAVYSGLINVDQLELGINFASHGNKRADGNIFSAFSNGLDEITGSFELFELENRQVKADGSFKVKP